MTKQELQDLAVKKAKYLTRPGTQQRLTADIASYWIVNFAGILHIGYFMEGIHRNEPQPAEPFYPGEQEYEMLDKNNRVTMRLQRLRTSL